MTGRSTARTAYDPEPRWQAAIAIVAASMLQFTLPPELTLHPRWLFPGTVGVLLVPLVIAHRSRRHRLDSALGYTVTVVMTIALVISLALLIVALPKHVESASALLRSAASLWTTNVLVFSLWYWRLDAGGPHRRDARGRYEKGSFLFPQLTLLPEVQASLHPHPWRPHFLDYLFLAFNTSTAFSPTDTAVLTRKAKMLMMLQSLISLAVLALLAARAVNIL
jgi:hypothetical protein